MMMWSQTKSPVTLSSSSSSSSSSSEIWVSHTVVPQTQTFKCNLLHFPYKLHRHTLVLRNSSIKLRASLEQDTSSDTSPLLLQQNLPNYEFDRSLEVLKNAAKTRKVPKTEILSALAVVEKAKIDPSTFLETLGGSKSPGRTWMLIFTAEKQLKGGRYFPLTAVQRFDAEAKRIENGVFLGWLGNLTFEGRFSWKNRILAFIFERIRLKIGPFNPLEVSLGNQDNSEPNNKNPFFIWFYVDEEIAVARGRSGGTAFWCRCRRVTSS